MQTRLPLTLLPGRLARISLITGQRIPGYRSIYQAALDARIPAERADNGRWSIDLADLPEIAAAFNLTIRQSGAAPTQHAA